MICECSFFGFVSIFSQSEFLLIILSGKSEAVRRSDGETSSASAIL